MTVLQFISAVRFTVGLPPTVGFDHSRARRGSETDCLLALALGCEIGAASDPSVDDGVPQLVMRFPSIDTARKVAATTGCAWCKPLPAVLLPATLADIAVAFDDGLRVDAHTWGALPVGPHPLRVAA